MRTMTKERKKEGPRLGHKGRADAKASRQLLLLCIPAIIGYILFNYIPMGAAVIIPFKNYKFSKGILGSAWCGLANFKWIIQSVALDRALRNTVLYGLLFMVLSPVTNVIIALLLFEITSRRRLKTYQTIITFPNFMSMVIVGYIVYAILSPRTGLMNQIIQFFGGDPVDVYMNSKYWPFILTVVNIWKGIGMGSMMYFAALMGIDTSLYEAAEIDGASRFQKMLHISLPHLVPLICIFTIMNAGTLISGNFDLFYVIPRNTSTLYATTDSLIMDASPFAGSSSVSAGIRAWNSPRTSGTRNKSFFVFIPDRLRNGFDIPTSLQHLNCRLNTDVGQIIRKFLVHLCLEFPDKMPRADVDILSQLLHSQFFREVRLHIDTGAPDGIAFQRVLLRDIALFGKQRPDGVHVRRHSLRGGQHAQRRSHHVTSELRGQCLIPAANFCAQFLHQRAHQQSLHAQRSIAQQRLDFGIHLPVILVDARLQCQKQLQKSRNALIPVLLAAQICFFPTFRVQFL